MADSFVTLPFWLVFPWIAQWVVAPLLTLLHELGHAAAALLLPGQPVAVRLGADDRGRRLHLGRLTLIVKPKAGWVGFCSYAAWSEIGTTRRALISLAGPLTSLASTVACGALAYGVGGPWWLRLLAVGCGTLALWQLLWTATPMRYPRWMGAFAGYPSDGLRVVRWLRGRTDLA